MHIVQLAGPQQTREKYQKSGEKLHKNKMHALQQDGFTHLTVVLWEYSKFRIESNSYFSIRFDSKQAQLFKIFEYLNDVSVKMCTVLLLTMVQVLYLLEVFILAHYYGPPSTKTPTTETTTVRLRCHKNSWIYLTSTYYWWLLRPTITIRFDSKFQIIAQLLLLDLIRNEKHYSHSTRRKPKSR